MGFVHRLQYIMMEHSFVNQCNVANKMYDTAWLQFCDYATHGD